MICCQARDLLHLVLTIIELIRQLPRAAVPRGGCGSPDDGLTPLVARPWREARCPRSGSGWSGQASSDH